MKPGDKYRLGVDVISFKENKVYGRRLEEVTLISDHGNVCIVQGIGESFSVEKRLLIGDSTEEEPVIMPPPQIPTTVSKKKTTSKSKSGPGNSNTLF